MVPYPSCKGLSWLANNTGFVKHCGSLVRETRKKRFSSIFVIFIVRAVLAILGKYPAAQCADCKKAISLLLGSDLTERQSYAKHFPKPVLDGARLRIVELDKLLAAFEQRLLIWMRANHYEWQQIGRRFARDRNTAARRWKKAIDMVVAQLNACLSS